MRRGQAMALAVTAASHLPLTVKHFLEYALRAIIAGHGHTPYQPVDLDNAGNAPRPAGLMAGAHTGADVAIEVLVEQQVVTPQGVVLELLRTAEDRAPPFRVPLERTDQSGCQLVSDLRQVHHPAETGGALHLERVPAIGAHADQRVV